MNNDFDFNTDFSDIDFGSIENEFRDVSTPYYADTRYEPQPQRPVNTVPEPTYPPEDVPTAARNMLHLLFVAVFFIITVIPFIGMIFGLGGENSENRTLARMPSLFVSSSDSSSRLNNDFTGQFEEYVSDNFGFRQEIISLWSAAQYYIFSESAVEEVMVGNDDWLFYSSTKADFEGANLYSDRTIFRIAKTVELMDRYVTDSGAAFAFTVAPNKATVYPEFMSRRCIPSQVTNLSRLNETMADKEYYIDLVSLFNRTLDRGTEYYYRYDSHWNNIGAMEVYRTFQKYFAGKLEDYTYNDYAGVRFIESTRSSDLSTMLLPQMSMTEPDLIPDIPVLYSSESPITNRLAVSIRTSCPTAPSSLYMFRDSFGSSLIDTFSNNYGRVTYSRALPYDLKAAIDEQFGAVIVEIVERNLLEVIRRTPIAEAPPCAAPEEIIDSYSTINCQQTVADGTISISGVLDPYIPLADTDCIYIEFRGENQQSFFEAFPICDGDAECDRGFTLSIPEAELLQGKYYMYVHVGTPEVTTAYALYV